MLNENLTDRVRWMKSRKEALEAELKLVADELAECEGRLKAEQERAAAVEAACLANKFLHDRRTRRLAEYFKVKGLLITSLQETTPLLKTRYKIAKMIYGAQNALVPVLKVLYARRVDEYDLTGLSTDDKTAVCNFLTQLQKIGWLTWSKKGEVVSFKRTIPNEQYVFFNGGWAEEATRYLIEKTLHDLKIPSSKTYREVKVDAIGPEQDVHEFDFIVEFRDRNVMLAVGRYDHVVPREPIDAFWSALDGNVAVRVRKEYPTSHGFMGVRVALAADIADFIEAVSKRE